MLRNVPRVVLWLGILMVLVGLISRYMLRVRGVSGFTPLIFGMPIAVLGLIGLDPPYRRSALRGVAGLSLLVILLTLPALADIQALLRGAQAPAGMTVTVVGGVTHLLAALLLIVCIAALIGAWWQRRRS